MPELPEVETVVRQLRRRLTGRRLTQPQLHHTDVLRGVTRGRLLRALAGAEVRGVSRRAKHAIITVPAGRVVIQLRMTGALIVYDRPLTPDERRYVVLEARIGRASRFVFRDIRRLGTIYLLDDRGWRTYTQRIGPEPLSPSFTAARLRAQLGQTRQAIKKALMDQRLVAGVGNIYANEALFRAGIDPSRPAVSLSANEYRRLHRAVRVILNAAVQAGGTTVRDYRTGTGAKGTYQHGLLVYGRGGDPCSRCSTILTTTHSIDGRATTFCWRCQGNSQ